MKKLLIFVLFVSALFSCSNEIMIDNYNLAGTRWSMGSIVLSFESENSGYMYMGAGYFFEPVVMYYSVIFDELEITLMNEKRTSTFVGKIKGDGIEIMGQVFVKSNK